MMKILDKLYNEKMNRLIDDLSFIMYSKKMKNDGKTT